MTAYLLAGPDLDYGFFGRLIEKNVKKPLNNIYPDLIKYDNGNDNKLYCANIALAKNSQITIMAHGSISKKNTHHINLCEEEHLNNTDELIHHLRHFHANDIELISCYGGAAINSISMLNPGSTLITFSSPDTPLLFDTIHRTMEKFSNFSYKDNPFIRFADYLGNHTDDLMFAIQTATGNIKIFTSLIRDLDNLSITKIREWHTLQTSKFIDFCLKIKNDVTDQHKKQIQTLETQFQSTVTELTPIHQVEDYAAGVSDTVRYKLELPLTLEKWNDYKNLTIEIFSSPYNNFEISFIASLLLELNRIDTSNHELLAQQISPTIFSKKSDRSGNSLLHLIAGEALDIYQTNQKRSPQYGSDTTALKIFLSKSKEGISERNSNGYTPLHIALRKNNTEIARMLIEELNPEHLTDQDTSYGQTPLHLALEKNNTEIARILINKLKVSDFNIKDKVDQTIFHSMARSSIDIVNLLLPHMSPENFSNQNSVGWTPLYIAVINEKKEIAELLISQMKPEDLSKHQYDKTTPLYIAIRNGFSDIAISLIKKMNYEDLSIEKELSSWEGPKDGTFLSAALKYPNVKIVHELLATGIDLSKESQKTLDKVTLITQDQVKFILEYQEEATDALVGMKNLKSQEHMQPRLAEIEKIEDCLAHQPEGVLDLVAICGDNGSYYREIKEL